MTLTLITGGSSAAIVNESRDVLREALTCGNDAIWILPDRRSARMESSLTSATTPVGIEATTFAALLESLWSLYGDGRRLVERETRDLLLQSALAESSDALGTLSASDALRTAIGRALASGSLREGSSAGGSYKGISQMLDYYRTLLYDSNLIEPMDAIPLLAFPTGSGRRSRGREWLRRTLSPAATLSQGSGDAALSPRIRSVRLCGSRN